MAVQEWVEPQDDQGMGDSTRYVRLRQLSFPVSVTASPFSRQSNARPSCVAFLWTFCQVRRTDDAALWLMASSTGRDGETQPLGRRREVRRTSWSGVSRPILSTAATDSNNIGDKQCKKNVSMEEGKTSPADAA